MARKKQRSPESIRAEARAEAYNEAAGHLEQTWTDDPIEREEGLKLAKRFYRQSIYWTRRGNDS
jgi:hypothetical protein